MNNIYKDNDRSSHIFSIKVFALILFAVLTLSLAVSLSWNIIQQKNAALESARIHARTALYKDILYRRWNSSLGGVYAAVTDETRPNPYLEGMVGERDIETPSGKALTLINPAYMTRQVHELEQKDQDVLGHITSLKPIRPENAADDWERRVLLLFEDGTQEVSSIEMINGREYMRLMRPLITEDGCLKCHERQGYRKGDIRGGISVSVPMEPVMAALSGNFKVLLFAHIILWFLGIGAIYAGYRVRRKIEYGRRHFEEMLRNSAEEWRTTFDSITDLVSVHDTEFRILKCNKAFADFLNKKPEEVIGIHCYELVHGIQEPFPGCPHNEMLKTGKTHTKEIFDARHGLHLMVTVSPIFENGELAGSVHYVKDITERKKGEEKLHWFNELMKYVISHAQSAIAVHDRDMKYIYVSDQYLKQYKVKEKDVIGKHHYDVFPDLPQKWRDVHQRVLAGAVESKDEDPYIREDGTVDWTRWSCRPWYEYDGSIGGLIVYTEVITERKKAEHKLIESEEKFRSIFDNATDGILLADFKDKKFFTGNKVICEMLGYSLDEIQGIGVMDIHPEKDIPYVVEQFERQARGEIMLAADIPVKRKDGTVFYADINSSSITLSGKKYLIGMFRDITQRKKAEDALLASERRFRETLENVQMIALELDPSGRVLFCNDFLLHLMGWLREEVLGQDWFSRFLPENERESMRAVHTENIRASKRYIHYENPITTRNGELRHIRWSNTVLHSPDGSVASVVSLGEDITERKKADAALLASENMLMESQAIAGLGSYALDLSTGLWTSTDVLDQVFGIDEAYERSVDGWQKLIHPDDRIMIRDYFENQVIGQGNPFDREYRIIRHNDNAERWVHGLGKLEFDAGGRVLNMHGTIQDITERKLAEQDRERLNSELEQILYAATHDLKSPLVNINGYSRELKHTIDDITRVVERADMSQEVRKEILPLIKELPDSFRFISTSVLRMDALLNGLLAFSRSGRVELKEEDIDMDMMLKDIAGDINYKLKDAAASLQVSGLPGCRGDREQLSRVFSNLIENAVKYLQPGRKGEIKVFGHIEGNRSVYCVEDNGVGIAAEHQKQIFHIFHQLDPTKTGEGLGLAIVQRIVERHGGKVWIESEEGKGSRFYVALLRKA